MLTAVSTSLMPAHVSPRRAVLTRLAFAQVNRVIYVFDPGSSTASAREGFGNNHT